MFYICYEMGKCNTNKIGIILAFVFALLQFTVSVQMASNIIWQKCLGSTGTDSPGDFAKTSDGGFIISGTVEFEDGDVTGFHGGDNDAWVVKLDSSGNIQWQKCYGAAVQIV